MLRSCCTVVFLILCLSIRAQEKLSLNDAISIVLKNNYSILISSNEKQRATQNNTIGNAGMLPSLDAQISGGKTINALTQKYSSGLEVDKGNVQSSNLTAGVFLNWTLFDGLKMFATKSKLEELALMGDLDFKIEVENTIASVITAYFDVVQEKVILKTMQDNMEVYEERLKIATTKFNIGSGSNVEVLQAKIDMNDQKAELIRQQVAVDFSKINLNHFLARSAETLFEPADTISVSYNPKLEDLKTTVVRQNRSLLLREKSMNVSAYALKEAKSLRYPRLAVNAGYDFSRTKNEAGFLLKNDNTGLNYGFTATWNLFNGFNTNRTIKNAKLDYRNDTLRYADFKSEIDGGVLKTFRIYQAALLIVDLESENVKLSDENLNIALERFKIGKFSSLELKDAQQSFENAEVTYVKALYAAKISETELMRLNGELVK